MVLSIMEGTGMGWLCSGIEENQKAELWLQ
jgi:hypothetical protein